MTGAQGGPSAGAEQRRRSAEVFDAVAERYDLMNDLMSLGSHRLLKRALVELTRLRRGQRALDLAGGSGDVAALLATAVGGQGGVVLADINASMLAVGRDRMLDEGCANVDCVQTDGTQLAFPDGAFDAVTIAFGLRNFADKEAGLCEMHRVLRPGGVAAVLEFAKPRAGPPKLLGGLWDAYRGAWPILGRLVVGDAAPYRYLVDSIDRHPDQDTLSGMMEHAGFAEVECHDIFGGIVAIHRGVRGGEPSAGGAKQSADAGGCVAATAGDGA